MTLHVRQRSKVRSGDATRSDLSAHNRQHVAQRVVNYYPNILNIPNNFHPFPSSLPLGTPQVYAHPMDCDWSYRTLQSDIEDLSEPDDTVSAAASILDSADEEELVRHFSKS